MTPSKKRNEIKKLYCSRTHTEASVGDVGSLFWESNKFNNHRNFLCMEYLVLLKSYLTKI